MAIQPYILGESQMTLTESKKSLNKGYKMTVFKVNTFRSSQLFVNITNTEPVAIFIGVLDFFWSARKFP